MTDVRSDGQVGKVRERGRRAAAAVRPLRSGTSAAVTPTDEARLPTRVTQETARGVKHVSPCNYITWAGLAVRGTVDRPSTSLTNDHRLPTVFCTIPVSTGNEFDLQAAISARQRTALSYTCQNISDAVGDRPTADRRREKVAQLLQGVQKIGERSLGSLCKPRAIPTKNWPIEQNSLKEKVRERYGLL